jgi:hypothetical protein
MSALNQFKNKRVSITGGVGFMISLGGKRPVQGTPGI